MKNRRLPRVAGFLLLSALLAACGSSGQSGNATPVEPGDPVGPVDPAACGGESFESTFAAVQAVVFDRYGCLDCHVGDNASGELDLSPEVAWENLHDVPGTIGSYLRIAPGAARRSLLWRKLAAATLGDDVAGSPMPSSGTPLSENDLDLVYWWIYAGAPKEGVVIDALPFVEGCLPDPEPLEIKPLAHPGAGKGIQLEMPEFILPAGLEVERCFASYYDVCDEVPEELSVELSDGTEGFFFDAREVRMDPGSHHIILGYSSVGMDQLNDPAWGGWTCAGGEDEGESCEPGPDHSCSKDCVSAFRDGFTCGGYGPRPRDSQPGRGRFSIGGSQRAQNLVQYPEGVYNNIPCRGVLLWNPHAFNLTTKEQRNHARLNYYFADADNLVYPSRGGLTGPIFKPAGTPPFARATICAKFAFPRGSRVYELSSHTHGRGEYFWITGPDGTLLYENYNYNDPDTTRYSPELRFDSEDSAERTVEFCAIYNNGVNDDGTPDVERVTRASRIPASARVEGSFGTCVPEQCVNPGMVGEPCSGEDDDASCDTPGGPGGDGDCDACPITAGESTQNEMFLMIPGYYVVELDDEVVVD